LFDYTLDNGSPAMQQTLWSRELIHPLGAGTLTPFSASILSEVLAKAWFRYRDLLGDPLDMLPQNAAHIYQGHVYANLSLFCQQDADFAGSEPIAFRINDQMIPACPWDKPGFLANIKFKRNQKKILDLIYRLANEPEAFIGKARSWHEKVTGMMWSQAEILQIMEEIERVTAEALTPFLVARHNLERIYNSLLRLTNTSLPFPQNLAAINDTFTDLQGLNESQCANQLLELSQLAHADDTVMSWLQDDHSTEDWKTSLPDGDFSTTVQDFLSRYGHWGVSQGELRHPRLGEIPSTLFQSILSCAQFELKRPARVPSGQSTQRLLAAIDEKLRQPAQENLEIARQLFLMQSHALDGLSYVWAATRVWALAAGQEGMSDGRLEDPDEVFFFELEELKQMMTGEWNISARREIRETLRQRQAQFAEMERLHPGTLLVGDQEARSTQAALPAVSGKVSAPFRRQELPTPLLCNQAIVGTTALDNGWALTLPGTAGFATAEGSPLDPIVAAARVWNISSVVGLGPAFEQLTDGAITEIDGGAGHIDQ
jgi:hypothetical protein